MRRYLILAGLLLFYCWRSIAGAQVHVIITAGQSNTDGRVPNKLLPAYIKTLATDTISFARGAYRYCKIARNRNDGRFIPYFPKGRISEGYWTYDAVTYYRLEQALQHDFYVVKYAVGGTSIQYPSDTAKGRYWSANADWLAKTTSCEKGGKSLLLSFTEAIDAAIDSTLSKLKRGYQVDAFLWHQGESDDRYDRKYYENLGAIIAYVRKHLTERTGKDYSHLPFVFGSIPYANRHFKPLVDEAMRRIAEEDPNAYFVDMSEGALQQDRTHFTEKSAEYLGEEMYKLLAKILWLDGTGFHIAKYRNDKTCAISYTFDDGLLEQATLAAPAFDRLGFKATFFVNGRSIEDTTAAGGKPRVSWEQLKQMSVHGHEISNHGWEHRNFGKFLLKEIATDIAKNDSVIGLNTGATPRTFAYPNNTKTSEGVALAGRGRIATRLLQFSVGGKSTKENLEKKINELLANGAWGVTMTHGLTYGYDHFSDTAIFWDHLKKVKALEDKIWVGTFREVAAYSQEQKAITYEVRKIPNGLTILPELKLDQSLYTEPLTAVIEKRNIKSPIIYQGDEKLIPRVLANKILFDFDPHGKKIIVTF
ncbi:polysaccharide deacetylase family protein [Niabella soli]|uniref:polysaccharide deacetylase family protein n=1 Tax=Niabella soli TaxID=446683 RepID=UPI00046CADE9|nr:polysaccharide deacetylase family protein [Niabella soli]